MLTSASALLVVDVEEFFCLRPYWRDSDVPSFIECLRSLIDGAQSRRSPVIKIFYVEGSGPFSLWNRVGEHTKAGYELDSTRRLNYMEETSRGTTQSLPINPVADQAIEDLLRGKISAEQFVLVAVLVATQARQ